MENTLAEWERVVHLMQTIHSSHPDPNPLDEDVWALKVLWISVCPSGLDLPLTLTHLSVTEYCHPAHLEA